MDKITNTPTRLDPREEYFHVPSPHPGLSLFLRYLPPDDAARRRTMLYVHGGTFPSALSIAHRFDGYSWRDALNEAGFDVWGLDFHGFGGSDRYPAMSASAESGSPLCAAADAGEQQAVAHEHALKRARSRSQGDADADFASALRNGVGDYTVNADHA